MMRQLFSGCFKDSLPRADLAFPIVINSAKEYNENRYPGVLKQYQRRAKQMKTGAIITAAGTSSRMGDFKPLMPYEGTTILQVIIRKLRECGVTEIVIVGGYRFDEVAEIARTENVDAVFNDGYQTNHMFDSICMGMRSIYAKADRVFFWPVDVPGVRIKTVKKLLKDADNSDVSAIVPYYNNEPGHPMLIMKKAFDVILSHDGTRGLRGAVEKFDLAVRANTDDPFTVLDTDTQEEYRKLLSLERSWKEGGSDRKEEMDFNIRASIKRGSVVVNDTLFDLLEQIRKAGSIRQACEEIGISYTKAWTILKNAQIVFGSKLMQTQSGGSGGGGAELTEEGNKFIRSYDAFCGDIDKYASGIFDKYFGWTK